MGVAAVQGKSDRLPGIRAALRLFAAFVFVEAVLTASICGVWPDSVILFIGDGMGPEEVKAGGMFANGQPGTLSFEQFPNQGTVTTFSANAPVTDSAASATAMATGSKVDNGVISIAVPGNGMALPTLLEISSGAGMSVGLVTTAFMTHATPAAFGAHEPSRNNYAEIASDYLTQSRPNVLLGGGGNGMSPSAALAAGYAVAADRAELLAVDSESAVYVSGQFGTSHLPYEFDGLGALPHLSEMVAEALAILDNDPEGFFLMVEGGRIDHAGHANDIERSVRETKEFSNAVQVAVDWSAGRGDTLIVVTADHETGGLQVLANNGQGNAPSAAWSTTGHTAADVPVYAIGRRAGRFRGRIDNTDIFRFLSSSLVSSDARHWRHYAAPCGLAADSSENR
jgi:alkaline phosphatase